MANRLKMALAESIHTLYQRGWSQRRIARELGINRETVAGHLKSLSPAPKPANAPLGSGPVADDSKPANAPLGPEPHLATTQATAGEPGRLSGCEPWRAQILEKLLLGLSAQRIYQDLVTARPVGRNQRGEK
jgi:hypothetical protein